MFARERDLELATLDGARLEDHYAPCRNIKHKHPHALMNIPAKVPTKIVQVE